MSSFYAQLLQNFSELKFCKKSLYEYKSHLYTKAAVQRFSVKSILRNFAKFTGKRLCQSLFFNKKETLAQVFSCDFCEISKNPFFIEHLGTTASLYTFH